MSQYGGYHLLTNKYVKFFSICIIVSFFVSCLLGLLSINIDCKCDQNANSPQYQSMVYHDRNGNKFNISNKPKLAVLVPYRERFEELLQFVPHMTEFLNKQQIPHHLFILNQVDRYRFNRASLINVGFLETKQNYSYISMHDVDLLPLNDALSYGYPSTGPFHVASPKYHPKYHYETFVGGILLVKREHFELVNGMSNKYWGWGLEDDEFYVRLKDAGLTVTRPSGLTTNHENTFAHIHDRSHRRRDTTKCFNQREVTRKRDRTTGLNTIKYKVLKKHHLQIDQISVTILNIELYCDRKLTPWCDCENSADKNVGFS